MASSGSGGRTKDYSNTIVDPVNDTDMWTIQQYAASPHEGINRWGTSWGRITPDATPCLPPATPPVTQDPLMQNLSKRARACQKSIARRARLFAAWRHEVLQQCFGGF
jgi:hypothetical protein